MFYGIIILQHLTQRQLPIMFLKNDFGAEQIIVDSSYVEIHFSGCSKANIVMIEINMDDLYQMSFFKAGHQSRQLVKVFDDIFCSNLKQVFEDFTGLPLD